MDKSLSLFKDGWEKDISRVDSKQLIFDSLDFVANEC